MAVIYSKLGGCLGVTAKLDPVARTDLWAGVRGLLERLITHLGLGSSLEDPWGAYWGVVVRLSSQEIVLFSWEAWGALCLLDCLRPCLTDLAWLLGWPAGGELLPSPKGRWAVAGGELLPSLERRRVPAWLPAGEELLPSLEGRRVPAWLPAGEELLPSLGGRWAIAWEELLPSLEERRVPAWLPAGEELLPSLEGRRAPAWLPAGEELLPSLGGRWAIAWEELLPSLEGRRAPSWLPAGEELLPSLEGRRVPAWLPAGEELLPSLGGRWAIAWEELLPSLEGRRVPAWLPAGEELLPSPERRWAVAWEVPAWLPAWLLPSLEGRRVPACLPVWAGLLPSLEGGEALACLPACEAELLVRFIALALAIFPSFLLIRILNLFNCLCLTLVNLISLTLSMKPWHSLSLCAEIIDASWVLHSSVCLATLSKMLLIAFTLAWSKSFSAFLIICLALTVFKVDLSLMLTGTRSLWRYLRVKILSFL